MDFKATSDREASQSASGAFDLKTKHRLSGNSESFSKRRARMVIVEGRHIGHCIQFVDSFTTDSSSLEMSCSWKSLSPCQTPLFMTLELPATKSAYIAWTSSTRPVPALQRPLLEHLLAPPVAAAERMPEPVQPWLRSLETMVREWAVPPLAR